MKNRVRFFAAVMAVCLMAAMAFPAMAAESEGYTYTVRVFAGAQGTIDGEPLVVYENVAYGTRINFNINRVQLPEDSKYYVKGIRESGKDNSTVSSPSILVRGDIDYVVAYGILGSSVAYTVNYQDVNGNEIYPSNTYYGNVGDKPVVAYQYIEGYEPQAYSLGKTLSENAAENVFTFVYAPVTTSSVVQEGGQTPRPTPGGEGGGEVEPGPGGEVIPPDSGPGGEGTLPGETTPGGPSEYEDLDDNDTPLAPGSTQILPDVTTLSTTAKLAIAGGAILTVGIAFWLLIFRKGKSKGKEKE